MIDLPPGAYERNMRRIIRAHENAGSTERALQAMHDLLLWFLCQGRLSITGMADSWWHRGWTLGYESGKRDALSGELYSEACGRCRSRRCEGC
jgi:hypothetical protein